MIPKIRSDFDPQESVMDAMARQARRSLRSSSLSSLSSLGSSFSSFLDPRSCLTPPPSSEDLPEEPSPRGDHPQASLIAPQIPTAPPPTSGKRKRRKNPEKEKERQAKRQKNNPRKREGTRRERIDAGKIKKAEKEAVRSKKPFSSFNSSQTFDHKKNIFNAGVVLSKGLKLVQWDGM